MIKYTTINVFAYVDPQPIHRVNIMAKWYQEDKILESNYDNVVALRDGWKVMYKIRVYKFRRVKQGPIPKDKLIAYIKANPKRKYQGWIHHAQVYGKIKGQPYGPHQEYIPINIHL